MNQAIEKRRFDIIQLLVDHGYDPKAVDMCQVFSSWDPEIMEYFIERGADVETGKPLAWALCMRIRTTLGILKRYRDRFASFPEQSNIALRHHCKDGNLKWVSLLLYAGADPLLPGPVSPDDESDSDYSGTSALAYAALYEHFEIFSLKKVRLDPSQPEWREIASYLCKAEGVELLKTLLERGLDPNDQENGGSSLIQGALHRMDWAGRFDAYGWFDERRGKDNERARELLKVIHLLAKHGGRWVPESNSQVNSARKSLVTMKPDYTVEFVWIMAKFQACSREDAEALLRTPKIKKHTLALRERLVEIVRKLPNKPPG